MRQHNCNTSIRFSVSLFKDAYIQRVLQNCAKAFKSLRNVQMCRIPSLNLFIGISPRKRQCLIDVVHELHSIFLWHETLLLSLCSTHLFFLLDLHISGWSAEESHHIFLCARVFALCSLKIKQRGSMDGYLLHLHSCAISVLNGSKQESPFTCLTSENWNEVKCWSQ